MMKRILRGARGDEGSTLILTLFYAMLSLVLILMVTAATSLYLERKRLYSLADAAALVGAEAFELSSVSLNADEPTVTLHSPQVREAVSGFLRGSPADTFDALVLEDAASLDGKSASVTVSSAWRPPILTLFVPEGIRLEVTAVARSVFR
jgi:Tfp pilus assembly protein PilX